MRKPTDNNAYIYVQNHSLKRSIFLFLVCFYFQTSPVAQARYDTVNFASIDSFVLTIKYENDISKLAIELTSLYPDDLSKVRAIFKWITNNISFDYRFVNKGKEIIKPDCEGQDECPSLMIRWENEYLKKILRSKKAIADGYTRLFKKLCDLSFIQSETIPGYARTRPYQVGNTMGLNHYWNAVLVDTSWFYADPTWAAGYCVEDEESGLLLKFVKDYRNYYWLQPLDRFSRNHYPQTGKWVERPLFSKEQLFNKPHYFSIEILENLVENKPRTGVLKVKKGDTIHFDFNYLKEIRQIQVNSNIFRNPSLYTTVSVGRRKTKLVRDTWAEKKQVFIPFRRQGNNYQFEYVVNDNSLYYLELVFDFKPAIRYRVRVEN